jgi:membrane associated rhomboid family serine protease
MEGPGRPDLGGTEPPSDPSERSSGLSLEACYRHPDELTGVHCTRCGRPICTECMNPAPVGYQCPDCVRAARKEGPRRRVRLVLGRPGSLTTALLVVNIAVFVVEMAYGVGVSLWGARLDKLDQLGGLDRNAIAFQHQYWRLLTTMFLHAGFIHIAFNMYALYLFGYLIENTLGTLRFAAIYFVGGFLASVTSFWFISPVTVGVGASGAIFALLGAWVAYNYRRRGSAMAEANLQWAMFLIVINLVLGFSIRGIDNSAHIGGLVAGAAAGFVAEGWGPRSIRRFTQIGGFALLVVIGIAVTVYRVHAITT